MDELRSISARRVEAYEEHKMVTAELKEAIQRARDKGVTIVAIARITHLAESTVRAILKDDR